jgi:hypothetical protein
MNQEFNNAYSSPGTDDGRRAASDLDATTSSTSSLLTYGGILIALVSLGVLIVAGLARRRYSDRLLR